MESRLDWYNTEISSIRMFRSHWQISTLGVNKSKKLENILMSGWNDFVVSEWISVKWKQNWIKITSQTESIIIPQNISHPWSIYDVAKYGDDGY